jgi:hypothetical protein
MTDKEYEQAMVDEGQRSRLTFDIEVRAMIKEAVEMEREACAKVVEEWLHGEWHNQGVIAALMIRERGAP